MTLKYSFLVALAVILAACQKPVDEDVPNPFDDPSLGPPPIEEKTKVDPGSIVGLHQNIFSPTCANSGCHDGTFEPDFRSVESSYNTLVFHPVVKNNPNGDFTYRVQPGNSSASVIIERLTHDIDGQSGTMPLSVDPDSDWPENKDAYIQNIRDWIESGAKDMFGNSPSIGNQVPQVTGIAGYQNSQLLSRAPGKASIYIARAAGLVDIYIGVQDLESPVNEIGYNKYKYTTNPLNNSSVFVQEPELELDTLSSPISITGYFGETVDAYHHFSIDPSSLGNPGTVIFFRIYVQDPDHTVTEIPNDGSFPYIKAYFSLEIIS